MNILVINCGSSSIKYQLIDVANNTVLIAGIVERIGKPNSQHKLQLRQNNGQMLKHTHTELTKNHRDAFEIVQKVLFNNSKNLEITGIGHRVVHGGERFQQPTVIDAKVLDVIDDLSILAPLHNPMNLIGIEVCLKLFPKLPQVAIFDTAFHQSMPDYAYRYAVPENWYSDYQVRRYGFHGTSHAYVAKQAANYLNIPLNNLNLISLHLGNGASVTAIQNGESIDTSMGMTPLEGLIMGTRCGDLDPAIPFYIADVSTANNEDIISQLNRQSGLKGLCGDNDMREVLRMAEEGNHRAKLALESYCYRIKKYIGAYFAILGNIDAMIFTAGIGENSATIRAKICHQLTNLSIELDMEKNLNISDKISEIQQSSAQCKILVIKTNEELEIAQQTKVCIQNLNRNKLNQ